MPYYTIEELKNIGFASIGDNVKISKLASIYGAERITIGSNVRIDDFCVLSAGDGGIVIGNYVHIAVMCSLIGKERIILNDFCGLSSRVSIYSSSDDYSGEFLTNPTIPDKFRNVKHGQVILGKHVIIGSGTVILPGVTIGDGSAVGALSLVYKDLEPFKIYLGNPPRVIKNRSKKLLKLEEEFLRSYDNIIKR